MVPATYMSEATCLKCHVCDEDIPRDRSSGLFRGHLLEFTFRADRTRVRAFPHEGELILCFCCFAEASSPMAALMEALDGEFQGDSYKSRPWLRRWRKLLWWLWRLPPGKDA